MQSIKRTSNLFIISGLSCIHIFFLFKERTMMLELSGSLFCVNRSPSLCKQDMGNLRCAYTKKRKQGLWPPQFLRRSIHTGRPLLISFHYLQVLAVLLAGGYCAQQVWLLHYHWGHKLAFQTILWWKHNHKWQMAQRQMCWWLQKSQRDDRVLWKQGHRTHPSRSTVPSLNPSLLAS